MHAINKKNMCVSNLDRLQWHKEMAESTSNDIEYAKEKKMREKNACTRRESRVYVGVYMCNIRHTSTHVRKFVRFASLRTAIVAYAFCIQWPHRCRLNPLYRGENRSVFLRAAAVGREHVYTIVHPCVTARRLSHHRSLVHATCHYRASL